MNLQNIIISRENQEEQSNTNTLENYINNNKTKKNYDGEKSLNKEINNVNKNDSINYSNNVSNIIEKENNKEHNIEDNLELNNNNIEIDNLNNNLYDSNENNNINIIDNNNNKESNIKIEINENNENNVNNVNDNNKEEIMEKDIIDELIEKIRNNQDLGIPKVNPKKSFAELDEELKLGLQNLNKIKTKSNKKTILDTQNELEKKSYERNKKYNEVISELTKTLIKPKNTERQYKTGSYYNYKNMHIMKPSHYFQSERKNFFNENVKKKENKFYMSSIDGKMIVNGERRDLDKNEYQNNRQSYTNNKRQNYMDNNFFADFGNRKLNYYNKNYFKDELEKINKLLAQ